MRTLRSLIALPLRRFTEDENGASAVEYAIIAAGIGAVIVGTVLLLGARVQELFESVLAALLA